MASARLKRHSDTERSTIEGFNESKFSFRGATQLIFLLQCFEILDQGIDLSTSSLFNPSERLLGFDWLAVAIAPDRHLSWPVDQDNRTSINDVGHFACRKYSFVCFGDLR